MVHRFKSTKSGSRAYPLNSSATLSYFWRRRSLKLSALSVSEAEEWSEGLVMMTLQKGWRQCHHCGWKSILSPYLYMWLSGCPSLLSPGGQGPIVLPLLLVEKACPIWELEILLMGKESRDVSEFNSLNSYRISEEKKSYSLNYSLEF